MAPPERLTDTETHDPPITVESRYCAAEARASFRRESRVSAKGQKWLCDRGSVVLADLYAQAGRPIDSECFEESRLILSEALTNAAKYSNGPRIDLRLFAVVAELEMTLSYHSAPFDWQADYATLDQWGGRGLRILKGMCRSVFYEWDRYGLLTVRLVKEWEL